MNLYSFFRKKHSNPFVGAIFALAFLSSFFVFKAPADAQLASTWEFTCLFEPLTTDKNCKRPLPTLSEMVNLMGEVKKGNRSGIAYGKIPENKTNRKYADENGVNGITMVMTVNMDPQKAKIGGQVEDKNYFWDLVADDSENSFLIRLAYKDASGATQYKLQPIEYKKNAVTGDVAIFSTLLNSISGLPGYGGVSYDIDTSTNSAGDYIKIPFFTADKKNIVTQAVVKATMNIGATIPYGAEVTADLWYCGGLQDNATPPNQKDGRYTPRGVNAAGGEVEYFTPRGFYAYNNNGVMSVAYDGTKYPSANPAYCQSTTENVLETNPNSPIFGKTRTIMSGTAYYKIGETVTFNIPSKADVAADQATEIETDIQTKETYSDNLPACAVKLFGEGSVMGCVARAIYYIFYWPTAWAAGILGKCFDFFLGYSISDESYRASIIVTGWKLVRDISNIFFIIILVWTGFATVFDIGGISMKKVVPALIINALIINFSLFGTQVIIDISNITARLFYNTMTVCDGDCRWETVGGKEILQNPNKDTVGGYKSLSSKIIGSFNPQRIFGEKTLDSGTTPNNKDDGATTNVGGFNSQNSDTNLTTGRSAAKNSSDYAGYFIVVTLIASFLMFAIAKMFFGVMFMFAGRVVGLYMVMIFSPFAVLTRGNMPLVGKIKDLSWESWQEDLINYSLLAPIFVFFLYIIYAFINSDMSKVFVSSITNNEGFMETVLSVAIPMIIIYMLIGQGVTLARKYAGKAGEMMQDFGKSATGVAATVALGGVGLAAGGAAFAGRGIVRGADKVGISKWAATNKDNGGFVGGAASVTNKLFKWGQKSSMDMRNTKVLKGATGFTTGALGALGIKANTKTADQISSTVGIGSDSAMGGNVQARKDREKEREKRTTEKNDMSHLTDNQVEEVWKRRSDATNKIEAEKKWEQDRMKELESGDHTAAGGLTKEKSEELKTKREENKAFQKDLADAIASGNKVGQKEFNDKIEKNIKEQAAITTSLSAVIENKKKDGEFNDYKKTKAYEDDIKKAAANREKEYGKVSNAKELSAAMRYEYAQRMLEDSRFLVDGKKNTATMVLGGALTGGLLTNYIDSQQESARVVFSKIVKDFKKAHSAKDNKIVKYTEELNSINDLIDDHVKEAIKQSGDNITFESIKDNDAKKKDYFDKARTDARTKAELAKIDVDDAKDAYKKAKNPATNDALKIAIETHQKVKDELDALDNAHKNREQAIKDLERERKAAADAEDKKKAKEDNKKS